MIAVTVAVVGFAEAWGREAECFTSFAKSQFPKWLGCAMAKHEGLAGGLIAAAGALYAGYMAWSAVREQIDVDRSILQQARLSRAEDELEKREKELDAIRRAVSFHKPYVTAFSELQPALDARALALIKLGENGTLSRNYYDELPRYYERVSGPVEQLRRIYKKFTEDTAHQMTDLAGERRRVDGPAHLAAEYLLEGIESLRSTEVPAAKRVADAELRVEAAKAF